ncbi:DUF3892 domain-containing protein [Hathewaya limosa]|uniref:DUF3892 domain-containing protein n=1 Tax=Hathewaya limosa TaxID=1536 RepID=A0ABU0JQJ7_HATLI|nr:DUF3892 domain-containing protein [Hathewaya limosa]AWZ48029.1 DUF3892 domain-containing protein [Clostridiaceae bacterium 14S0207]MDQ0479339.1 hypothetical protein [Hathewaya limosa]
MGNAKLHVITGVVKDSKGEISAYRLENGDIVVKEQAVQMAKDGKIDGVTVATSKTGEGYLRSYGDGDPSNNLSNLLIIDSKEIH